MITVKKKGVILEDAKSSGSFNRHSAHIHYERLLIEPTNNHLNNLISNNIPRDILLQNIRHRNDEKLHRISNKNHRWNSCEFHRYTNYLLLSK